MVYRFHHHIHAVCKFFLILKILNCWHLIWCIQYIFMTIINVLRLKCTKMWTIYCCNLMVKTLNISNFDCLIQQNSYFKISDILQPKCTPVQETCMFCEHKCTHLHQKLEPKCTPTSEAWTKIYTYLRSLNQNEHLLQKLEPKCTPTSEAWTKMYTYLRSLNQIVHLTHKIEPKCTPALEAWTKMYLYL